MAYTRQGIVGSLSPTKCDWRESKFLIIRVFPPNVSFRSSSTSQSITVVEDRGLGKSFGPRRVGSFIETRARAGERNVVVVGEINGTSAELKTRRRPRESRDGFKRVYIVVGVPRVLAPKIIVVFLRFKLTLLPRASEHKVALISAFKYRRNNVETTTSIRKRDACI